MRTDARADTEAYELPESHAMVIKSSKASEFKRHSLPLRRYLGTRGSSDLLNQDHVLQTLVEVWIEGLTHDRLLVVYMSG